MTLYNPAAGGCAGTQPGKDKVELVECSDDTLVRKFTLDGYMLRTTLGDTETCLSMTGYTHNWDIVLNTCAPSDEKQLWLFASPDVPRQLLGTSGEPTPGKFY